MTRKESPPAGCGPLPVYAGGSGGKRLTAFGKPLETMGLQSYGAKADNRNAAACYARRVAILANRGKSRDCKVMGAKSSVSL